jgi:hypothetical protein
MKVKATYREIEKDRFLYFVRCGKKIIGSGISSIKPHFEGEELITSGLTFKGVTELKEG